MGKIFRYILILLVLSAGSLIAQEEQLTDGFTQFKYPNGQVASEGMIVNGKPDGYWTTYYISGVKKSEGKRNNHLLDSIWLFFSETGDTLKKISYMYGKKNGYSISYDYSVTNDPNNRGNVISRELFVNDKREGMAYYYYPDGALKETVTYENGRKNGEAREYARDGRIITVLEYRHNIITGKEEINRYDEKNQKIGTWREYYPDGRIKKEMSYIDGALNGLYKEFNEKGALVMAMRYANGKIMTDEVEEQEGVEILNEFDEEDRLIYSGPYRNDVPIGVHRRYNAGGEVISSVLYNDYGKVVSEGIVTQEGKKEGNWKDYYLSGELRAEGQYKDNKRTGQWVFYFKNGNIEQKGAYIQGRPHGLWNWYYDDGNLLREEYYRMGREDGQSTEYSRNGEILTKGAYIDGEKEGEWIYIVGDHTEKGKYISGMENGVWKHFYENGNLKYEGNYIQGFPDGKHRFYYENEQLRKEQYYVMGIRESNWKKYDREGNLVMTITYKDNVETRVNGKRIKLPESDIKIIR